MGNRKPIESLLIANRGEIAIRIARAAAELGIRTVAVHSEDDSASLHVRTADDVVVLPGNGARAYLDPEQLTRAAIEKGCDAVHPGYGFLSESAGFAEACSKAGLVFVGPRPAQLEIFGDKLVRVRANRQPVGLYFDVFNTGEFSNGCKHVVIDIQDLSVDHLQQVELFVDIIQRTLSDHLACFNDANPCTQLGQFVQDVAGDQDGFSHFSQRLQQLADFDSCARIEAAGGFIQ